MKKKLLILFLSALLLTMSACSGDGSGPAEPAPEASAPAAEATPAEAVTAFMDGMIAGDISNSLATYCTDATLFGYTEPDSTNGHIAATLYGEIEYAILETTMQEGATTAVVTTLITTTDFAQAAERLLSDERYLALTPEEQDAQYEAYILSEIIECGAGGLNRTLEVEIQLSKTGNSWQIVPTENLTRAMLGAAY